VDAQVSHDVVWNRFLKLTNLMSKPFFAQFADAYSLHINEWRIIMMLASMGEAASHELCEVTGLHPMNVSRSVASLREAGRVSERRDPNNLRRKIISLTPQGWALYRALIPHVQKMAAFLFASLSDSEIDQFGKMIDKLIERLEPLEPTSVDLLDPVALDHAKQLTELKPAAARKRVKV
jgi:DNA-binding MarR family transcriptional regulator